MPGGSFDWKLRVGVQRAVVFAVLALASISILVSGIGRLAGRCSDPDALSAVADPERATGATANRGLGRGELPAKQRAQGPPDPFAGLDVRPDAEGAPAEYLDRPAARAYQAGVLAEKRGDSAAALRDFRAALELEPENALYLEAIARLAGRLGRLDEAEELLERALAVREQRLGPGDPTIARTLRQLADVYQQRHRYRAAERVLERALEINEEAYGLYHTAVAASLSDLALLYQRQGRSADALPLLEAALDVEERLLGPAHPNVAARRSALGLLHRNDGRYEEAQDQLEEALFIKEQAFEADHPETAGALISLAHLYRRQQRYAEAESLLQRALAVNEEAYGRSHPRVALDLANLGVLYLAQEQYTEALPYYENALRMEDDLQWSETPQVSLALDHLARSAVEDGRADAAEEIYLWALEISERALGQESMNTRFLREQYDQYLRAAGREREADPRG